MIDSRRTPTYWAPQFVVQTRWAPARLQLKKAVIPSAGFHFVDMSPLHCPLLQPPILEFFLAIKDGVRGASVMGLKGSTRARGAIQ